MMNRCKINSGVTYLLALLLLVGLGTTKTNAQQANFGVKGGFNYSSVVGDLTEGVKFRFSGHGGIFVEFELTDKLKFQPELVYSSQGFQFSSDLGAIQNPNGASNQNDFIKQCAKFNFITVLVIFLLFEFQTV